ncbi:MAG: glycosyltransferase, partial [Vicinamibacterales bacterium]
LHVHGLWNRVVWAAAREAARAGVPYVLSPRGMLEPAARAHRRWRKRAGWALYDRRVVHGASLLHATSETERETLLALGTGAPVACIPNGIDLGPPRRAVAGGSPLVLFIGRVHPIKRLDLLIDAFASVRARCPDARLVIAGPDDPASRRRLTARAGRHAGAVAWTGPVDAAGRQSLLARASTLVMCSDSESFGMSVLEAMAAGVPVVVTRTCPWADVERHQAGCWVEQSVPAIADAILRLVEDPRQAQAMGNRGRTLAASRYEWNGIAAAVAARYLALPRPRLQAAAVPATP